MRHARLISRAFLLSLALMGADCAFAQPKKPAPVAARSNSLPLVLGAALGGVLIGGTLGFSLKKTPPEEKKDVIPPVFEDSPTPFAYLDTKEYVTRANAAFNSLLGVQNAIGQPFPNLLHPDDLTLVRTLLHNVYDGDRAHFSEPARIFTPSGELVHVQVTIKKADDARKPQSVFVALEDRTQEAHAFAEIGGARTAIRSIYQVISGDKSRSLDDKMKALLEMGCGRFDLPIGVLGRFAQTEEGGEFFETLFVQSPDKRIRPAMSLPRTQSHAVESKLLGLSKLPHAGNWSQHPFITANDEVAYLGAPVLADGKLFGMLSFSSLELRGEEFLPGEVELLQLMAEWVGGEIERENAALALAKQQEELLAANEKLASLATHDALTEAKNRRAFDAKLVEEWSRATRYGTPLSLILFDVDKFKSFNDTFGHQAGDEVLKSVARAVMSVIRTTDFFARYGGEEFALILPNTDSEGAIVLAERLRQKIEIQNWKDRAITSSFGVSSAEPSIKSGDALLEAADKALYESKENGRNRVTHIADVLSVA